MPKLGLPMIKLISDKDLLEIDSRYFTLEIFSISIFLSKTMSYFYLNTYKEI